jgi:hypothetical protein
VQLVVTDYGDLWRGHESYKFRLKDTNALLSPKAAAAYKRPGRDLCPPGHVPVAWCYYSDSRRNLLGMLPLATCEEAFAELEQMAGGVALLEAEAMVLPVELPPDPEQERIARERAEERRLQEERERAARPPPGPIARAFRGGSFRRSSESPPAPPAVPAPAPPRKRYIMSWGLLLR